MLRYTKKEKNNNNGKTIHLTVPILSVAKITSIPEGS